MLFFIAEGVVAGHKSGRSVVAGFVLPSDLWPVLDVLAPAAVVSRRQTRGVPEWSVWLCPLKI